MHHPSPSPLVRYSRQSPDPREFFLWRLPLAEGADVLSKEQVDRLKGLPEEALLDLLSRVSVAARELESLRRQLATRWQIIHPCPVCDSEVVGRADKVYCTPKCRQRAFAERRQNGVSSA